MCLSSLVKTIHKFCIFSVGTAQQIHTETLTLLLDVLSLIALQINIDGYMENPSWAPVRNRVHPHEFVFQKSRAIASDFCGIQTHEDELCSAWALMINSISTTVFFFPVITSQKHQKLLSNHRKSWSEARNHSWVGTKTGYWASIH